MRRANHSDCALLFALLSTAACLCQAAEPVPAAGTAVTFVACPIYRDTNNGRKSGCWLATELSSGVRYDITQSRSKPQLGHEVLVEGTVADGADACGGRIVAPVQVSVLESSCPSFMLPAEGFPGRRFQVSLSQVLPPADVVRPAPAPPYGPRTWAIEFTYDSYFLQYQYSEVILDEIARYALASHAAHVNVTGYAATRERIISSHALSEPSQLGRTRAELVAEALRRLGVADGVMQIRRKTDPRPLDSEAAMPEPSRRRVDIAVE
jgi:hypothetical protein